MNSHLSLKGALFALSTVALGTTAVACGGGEGASRPTTTTIPTATTPVPTGAPVTPIPGTGVTTPTPTGPVIPVAPTVGGTAPMVTTPPAPVGGSLLVTNATGFIDDTLANNPSGTGIIGPWYTYGDALTLPNITQPPGGTFASPTGAATTPNGQICFAGQTAIVPTQADFATIFGAGLGLDLNNTGGTAIKGSWNGSGRMGISFVLEGTLPVFAGTTQTTPSTIRVAFVRPGKADFAHFVQLIAPGPQVVMFSQARQGEWVAAQTPLEAVATLDTTQIEAIQFQVPSEIAQPVNFDFCISSLSVI